MLPKFNRKNYNDTALALENEMDTDIAANLETLIRVQNNPPPRKKSVDEPETGLDMALNDGVAAPPNHTAKYRKSVLGENRARQV